MDFNEFAARVIEHFQLDATDAHVATGLYSHLGMDSLQAFELLIVLEEWADVLLPPEQIPPLMTLGDAYNYFGDLLGSSGTWTVVVEGN